MTLISRKKKMSGRKNIQFPRRVNVLSIHEGKSIIEDWTFFYKEFENDSEKEADWIFDKT